MCCTISNQRRDYHEYPVQGQYGPMHCGCGCNEKDQKSWRLENYKAHLKAELKSVEDRIENLKKD